MLGLLIANLVVSTMILLALLGAGTKVWATARRSRAARDRMKVSGETMSKLVGAIVEAGARKRQQQAAPKPDKPDNVSDIKPASNA